MTALRIARRLVRKVTKPARLWLNAWQYKQSEEEVVRLNTMREDACYRMRSEYRRQVDLAMRRTEIVRW